MITAEVSGNEPVAVGPDETCACKVSTADGHLASVAPDGRAFEQVLARAAGGSGSARPHRRRPRLTAPVPANTPIHGRPEHPLAGPRRS